MPRNTLSRRQFDMLALHVREENVRQALAEFFFGQGEPSGYALDQKYGLRKQTVSQAAKRMTGRLDEAINLVAAGFADELEGVEDIPAALLRFMKEAGL